MQEASISGAAVGDSGTNLPHQTDQRRSIRDTQRALFGMPPADPDGRFRRCAVPSSTMVLVRDAVRTAVMSAGGSMDAADAGARAIDRALGLAGIHRIG